jgi:hypothetical protein
VRECITQLRVSFIYVSSFIAYVLCFEWWWDQAYCSGYYASVGIPRCCSFYFDSVSGESTYGDWNI